MSEGFNNKDYKTRYTTGEFPEEGEAVFQRRVVPASTSASEDVRTSIRTERPLNHNSSWTARQIRPRWRRALRIGSALGALLLIIYLGSKAYKVYLLSPEQLYAESFQPYVLKGAGAADTGWSRFETFYLDGSMDSIIRAARRKVILSDRETFIAGMAYLVADDPFWAIRQLKKLSGGEGANVPEADFYLALAYLKNRDYDHALTLMLQIRRRPGHPYRDHFTDDFIERVKLLKWR